MLKADWIAKQLKANADDVHDVLLGNITKPEEFVDAVQNAALDYEEEHRRGTRRGNEERVGKGGALESRFASF